MEVLEFVSIFFLEHHWPYMLHKVQMLSGPTGKYSFVHISLAKARWCSSISLLWSILLYFLVFVFMSMFAFAGYYLDLFQYFVVFSVWHFFNSPAIYQSICVSPDS